MSTQRVIALARRVFRQIFRDHRTVALFLIGPIIMILLAMILFRAEARPAALGIVNEDEGASILLFGEISLADLIINELDKSDALIPVALEPDDIDAALREQRVRAVLTFPPDFSASFAATRHAAIPLRLEGSDPARAASVSANLMKAAMQAMAGILTLGGSVEGETQLPLTIEPDFLYGGPDFDMLDYFAPPFIALEVFFFSFLLTTVSFLRERSQGTIERLMATPVTRMEIVTGYMLGFMTFAFVQAALLLVFTVVVVRINYAGNLINVFVVEALLVIVAVNLGIYLSTFARNEFQVLQFIPLVIFPMALLSGLFWAVEDLPGLLQPVARILPLTYANDALRAIMIKGWNLAELAGQIVAMLLIGAIVLVLAATTMRREIA